MSPEEESRGARGLQSFKKTKNNTKITRTRTGNILGGHKLPTKYIEIVIRIQLIIDQRKEVRTGNGILRDKNFFLELFNQLRRLQFISERSFQKISREGIRDRLGWVQIKVRLLKIENGYLVERRRFEFVKIIGENELKQGVMLQVM
eukprot:TRINITY_DN5933_c0_g1_i1.p5 TRINITY_DN5933_c0_g1~~TRINITY_DN5933_c0_g1_i1.p5  ORF type:complete len:147 (-),score=9.72 TRINITY_DN5933_c0_g1_i1:502-942(-)